MDSTCVAPVERLAGKGAALHVRPLVAPAFFTPLSQEEARAALALPGEGKMVLVSGGGWGVGDMEGTVSAALALPGVYVVCVTGRNAQTKAELEAAFDGDARVTVLGFTSADERAAGRLRRGHPRHGRRDLSGGDGARPTGHRVPTAGGAPGAHSGDAPESGPAEGGSHSGESDRRASADLRRAGRTGESHRHTSFAGGRHLRRAPARAGPSRGAHGGHARFGGGRLAAGGGELRLLRRCGLSGGGQDPAPADGRRGGAARQRATGHPGEAGGDPRHRCRSGSS